MPHLSQKKLDKETKKVLEEATVFLFSHSSFPETQKLFETLLTKTEQLMIAKRIGAAFLLKESTPEIQISNSLKLSRETVSRFALIMQTQPEQNWEFIFKKLEEWQKFHLLTSSLKKAGEFLLKKFSHGMAGKI